LVPWPSVDIHIKFYGDHPRGTPPPQGELNTNIAILDISNNRRLYLGNGARRGKLVLITNRKSYMSLRLVPKSATLNDLERLNGPPLSLRYFTEFDRFRGVLHKSG